MKISCIAGFLIFLMIRLPGLADSHFSDRAGIGFRGSYWHQRSHNAVVSVRTTDVFDNHVDVGGIGGWLSFFSGAGENGLIVFSLGGIAHVEVVEEGLFDEHVDVQVVSPFLIGYQHIIFSDRNTSAFLPYVSAGVGPYIMTHVETIQYSFMDDETLVRNKVKPGAYLGTGGYFLFTYWLAFHGEMRYHLVNFNPDNTFSGFEVGFGFAFSWRR